MIAYDILAVRQTNLTAATHRKEKKKKTANNPNTKGGKDYEEYNKNIYEPS